MEDFNKKILGLLKSKATEPLEKIRGWANPNHVVRERPQEFSGTRDRNAVFPSFNLLNKNLLFLDFIDTQSNLSVLYDQSVVTDTLTPYVFPSCSKVLETSSNLQIG